MVSKPKFLEVEGMKIPPFFSKECFESALRFKPKPGDIFVVTYPKCGTTWMQNVVLNVLRRGKPLEKPQDFFMASPFLDQLGADDSENIMIRPGAYKTHLPFNKVPWIDDAKYIYVARNPKDCCVSFYHHMKQIPGYEFSKASLDEFLDMFITGDLEYLNYFDHLLPWYTQRNRPNILFITYEDMKRDLKKVVLRVAEFIKENEGKHLRENPKILDKILHNCNFDEMKFINKALNVMYKNIDQILADPNIPRGRKHICVFNAKLSKNQDININFIRKGSMGDWKTVLTKDQNDKLNKFIKERSTSDIMALWEDVL